MVELALASYKKRYSEQTEFIHLFYMDPLQLKQETIPTLENFLYAYTLFRSKLVENIQQGKSLLERLLPFEVDGNFPLYLHEYPGRSDSCHSAQFLAPLFYLIRDFSLVLGESLLDRLGKLGKRIVNHLRSLKEAKAISFLAEKRLLAFLGELDLDAWVPKNLSEWIEFCVASQMAEKPFVRALSVWDLKAAVYIGEGERAQEGLEPVATLLDLFIAEASRQFSRRALGSELVHLKAALIQPEKNRYPVGSFRSFVALIEPDKRQALTIYFGSLEETHSLTLEAKTGSFSIIEKGLNQIEVLYTYDEEVPSEEDSVEVALYLSAHSSESVTINKEKATVFKAGELVSFSSPFLEGDITFSIDPKEGQWLGHISKGNRCFQKNKTIYSAYDWKIGWRTLRRNSEAKLCLQMKLYPIDEKIT